MINGGYSSFGSDAATPKMEFSSGPAIAQAIPADQQIHTAGTGLGTMLPHMKHSLDFAADSIAVMDAADCCVDGWADEGIKRDPMKNPGPEAPRSMEDPHGGGVYKPPTPPEKNPSGGRGPTFDIKNFMRKGAGDDLALDPAAEDKKRFTESLHHRDGNGHYVKSNTDPKKDKKVYPSQADAAEDAAVDINPEIKEKVKSLHSHEYKHEGSSKNYQGTKTHFYMTPEGSEVEVTPHKNGTSTHELENFKHRNIHGYEHMARGKSTEHLKEGLNEERRKIFGKEPIQENDAASDKMTDPIHERTPHYPRVIKGEHLPEDSVGEETGNKAIKGPKRASYAPEENNEKVTRFQLQGKTPYTKGPARVNAGEDRVPASEVRKHILGPNEKGEYTVGAHHKGDFAASSHIPSEHKAKRLATVLAGKIAKQSVRDEEPAAV